MEVKQFINGQLVNAINNGSNQLINPATEEVLGNISFGDADDCNAAIDAAREAFKTWSKTTPYFRAEILKKAAQYIRDNVMEMATDMVNESGKPITEAKGEFMVAVNLFEWFFQEIEKKEL